jgi:hypothetical protein
VPSGLNVTVATRPLGPVSGAPSRTGEAGFTTSHRQIFLSPVPAASYRPSRLKASESTATAGPVSDPPIRTGRMASEAAPPLGPPLNGVPSRTGYGEAIKAVEAAAHAVLEPNQRLSTLGKMRGHLRANLNQFSLVIKGPDGRGDTGPLLGCISLLWDGQTSRHGSSSPTRPETLEEAVMAVHLAVMLVQWFTSGAVRRV